MVLVTAYSKDFVYWNAEQLFHSPDEVPWVPESPAIHPITVTISGHQR